MQAPSTQVCPWGQFTPAHRSTIGTQLARHVVPPAQAIADAALQGSG
jgi:hypothetical protein